MNHIMSVYSVVVNSVVPDQTATTSAGLSETALFAQAYV